MGLTKRTLFFSGNFGGSGSSGVCGVGRSLIPPRGFGDKLLVLLDSGLSDLSEKSDSSEFCLRMPDIRRSCLAFISANTLPPTPMPSFDGAALARLGATTSSPSAGFDSDSGSLEVDPSRVLATGDLVGAGGGEASPVGLGLGFFPKMEDSKRTPIPRLGVFQKYVDVNFSQIDDDKEVDLPRIFALLLGH